LECRLVASAFDARGDAELVEELGELKSCAVDHLHVALLGLTEIAHPDERLREAVNRRQRGAQVVSGKRDEPREAGVWIPHCAA
jgi:hypothetical protein